MNQVCVQKNRCKDLPARFPQKKVVEAKKKKKKKKSRLRFVGWVWW